MQRKKIKNKNQFIGRFIFIFLILILVCLIYIQINNFFILDRVKIYTEVILGDRSGFDLNNTALTFGMVVPGNAASREISIRNNFEKSVRGEIISKGEISEFLIISENNFILTPNEERNISFSVLFPKGSEMKKYKGWIEIKLKNEKNKIFSISELKILSTLQFFKLEVLKSEDC